MKKDPDTIIPRILLLISLMIILYWIWGGLGWLWEWYTSVSESPNTTVWQEIWIFIKDNLSVIVLVYGIACLQAAGLAEMKFHKNFLKAFFLAICVTPPIMMGTFGRRKPMWEDCWNGSVDNIGTFWLIDSENRELIRGSRWFSTHTITWGRNGSIFK